MPTERFFRLPKAKADIIRAAAIDEFKRVTPEEASINRIVQNANISRGSFYTYFEDKFDLLKWIIGDFIREYRRFYVDQLTKNGGNIWEVFELVLDHTIHWVDAKGLVEIVGNMMRGTYLAERMQATSGGKCDMHADSVQYMKKLYQLVDTRYCELDFQDFQEMMEMHVAILIMALKQVFGDKADAEVICAAYNRRMRLLRYGACPRQE